jgi:hypothetical protein
MTYYDLYLRLHDQPFRPFRIRLVNNTVYDILEPWMIMIGEHSAVVVTRSRADDRGAKIAEEWRTISISHILELYDIDTKSETKRKGA